MQLAGTLSLGKVSFVFVQLYNLYLLYGKTGLLSQLHMADCIQPVSRPSHHAWLNKRINHFVYFYILDSPQQTLFIFPLLSPSSLLVFPSLSTSLLGPLYLIFIILYCFKLYFLYCAVLYCIEYNLVLLLEEEQCRRENVELFFEFTIFSPTGRC